MANIPVLLKKRKVTLRGRFIFSNVFEPLTDEYNDNEYIACILIDKKDIECLGVINEALQYLGTDALTLKDMDTDEDKKNSEVFKNKYLLRTKSKNKPDIVDLYGNHLTADDFYNGCYGYVSCVLTSYTYMNKVGVTAYLNNICKVADGEPLGVSSAINDFKAFIECYGNGDVQYQQNYISNTLTAMGVSSNAIPQTVQHEEYLDID